MTLRSICDCRRLEFSNMWTLDVETLSAACKLKHPSVSQSSGHHRSIHPSIHHVQLTSVSSVCFLLQKYRHHDEDSSPQDQSSPQLTEEAVGAELVQVAEKNLSQIQNVHGYVTHAHISPMKVGERVGFVSCLSSVSVGSCVVCVVRDFTGIRVRAAQTR